MLVPLFYLFSAVAVISALFVIALPKPSRALLWLIVTMFALAVIYLLLGAPFVAMAHLIVYAGAVLILFLFVIMLQGVGASDLPIKERFNRGYLLLANFVGSAFFALILFLLFKQQPPEPKGVLGNVELFGSILFKDYLVPFELTSLLLLVGVFAAVSLAKKDAE